MIIPLTHVCFERMIFATEVVANESLLSGAAVPHGKRCTGSSGQDALAERRTLCGVRSRQVLADRVYEQDRRTAALVPVRQLQVSVQCDDRNPVS